MTVTDSEARSQKLEVLLAFALSGYHQQTFRAVMVMAGPDTQMADVFKPRKHRLPGAGRAGRT